MEVELCGSVMSHRLMEVDHDVPQYWDLLQ